MHIIYLSWGVTAARKFNILWCTDNLLYHAYVLYNNINISSKFKSKFQYIVYTTNNIKILLNSWIQWNFSFTCMNGLIISLQFNSFSISTIHTYLTNRDLTTFITNAWEECGNHVNMRFVQSSLWGINLHFTVCTVLSVSKLLHGLNNTPGN